MGPVPPFRGENDAALTTLVVDTPPVNLFDADTFNAWSRAVDESTESPPRWLLVRAEDRVVSAGVDVVAVRRSRRRKRAAALDRACPDDPSARGAAVFHRDRRARLHTGSQHACCRRPTTRHRRAAVRPRESHRVAAPFPEDGPKHETDFEDR